MGETVLRPLNWEALGQGGKKKREKKVAAKIDQSTHEFETSYLALWLNDGFTGVEHFTRSSKRESKTKQIFV
jgi:hypothetical protein